MESRKLQFRVSDKLHQELLEFSGKNGINLSAGARQLIERGLRSYKRQNRKAPRGITANNEQFRRWSAWAGNRGVNLDELIAALMDRVMQTD